MRIPKYENIHFRLEYRNVLITFAAETLRLQDKENYEDKIFLVLSSVLITFAAETLRFQDKEYYEDKIFLVLSSAPLHQRFQRENAIAFVILLRDLQKRRERRSGGK